MHLTHIFQSALPAIHGSSVIIVLQWVIVSAWYKHLCEGLYYYDVILEKPTLRGRIRENFEIPDKLF